MFRDARATFSGTQQLELPASVGSRDAQDLSLHSLEIRASRLRISRIEIDQGDTFKNRFLLVWHQRRGCFRDVVYRSFWQQFAKHVCNEGPRVDDTLHVIRSRTGNPDFWVIGGDGRLASHCANGLMYAGQRYAERHDSSSVAFQCGRELRTVRVNSLGAQVNLGKPRPMPFLSRFPAPLRCSPLLVNTGEPHAVSFDEDVAALTEERPALFSDVGHAVCRMGAPAGINWNLVTPLADGLQIRTFERGVRRPTTSCGTGSAAAFYAAQRTGRYDCDQLPVKSAGGCHVVSRHKDEFLVTGAPTHQSSWALSDLLSAAL